MFDFTDCYFRDVAHINRAGLNYQGDYIPRDWAQTTVGYEFEDENGFFDTAFTNVDPNDPTNPKGVIAKQFTHGLRLNHAPFAQQRITRGRTSVVGGVRYVHNDSFGNPRRPTHRVDVSCVHGGSSFSGTRLRFGYSQASRSRASKSPSGSLAYFLLIPTRI